MGPFVNRNVVYIQETQFACLVQSTLYSGIETRDYLDVKVLSSGYICKLWGST